MILESCFQSPCSDLWSSEDMMELNRLALEEKDVKFDELSIKRKKMPFFTLINVRTLIVCCQTPHRNRIAQSQSFHENKIWSLTLNSMELFFPTKYNGLWSQLNENHDRFEAPINLLEFVDTTKPHEIPR